MAFRATGEDKVTRLWIRSLDSLEKPRASGGEMSATPPPCSGLPIAALLFFKMRES